MKNAIVIGLLVAGSILGCTKDPIAPAELSNNPLSSQLDKDVDALIQKHRNGLNTVGMTVGFWKDGESSTYGYGEIKKGGKQVPDAHTFFEIGSITKTFTAAAMVQWLNEQGLSLDSPIQPFLPSSIPALSKGGVTVNFKQILNHSSGIAYFPSNLNLLLNDDAKELARYSEAKLFDYLEKGKLNATPGTRYEYSNTAMGLAGTILARENKTTYGDYLQTKVCEPLGLFETKAKLSSEEKTRMADGHRGGKKVDLWESLGALDGAGILRSTTSDLLKYGAACINPPNTPLGRAMSTAQVSTLKNAKNLTESVEVCLGWHQIKTADQTGTLLFHDGGTGGFNCSLILDKEKKLVLVVCYNSYNGGSKAEAEARTALNNDLLLLLR
ncbi:serine hydrolase domain-containing protein [Haliscomenobacter sp.]|uniref:serine hydrolase domain-containing protein n=1 Tax=Haliscomenobacter sp. TaxID=2717303 RepID=UPI003592E881